MRLIRDRLSVVKNSLVSESSSESVTKADSLGSEDGNTGALSFLGVSGGGFSGEGTTLTLEVPQMNQTQTSPLPPLQKSALFPW